MNQDEKEFDYLFLVKGQIISLCNKYSIRVPMIRSAMDYDKCDVTTESEIRLKYADFAPMEYYARVRYHAAHVFGHYCCDLHAQSDKDADFIADFIARLVTP